MISITCRIQSKIMHTLTQAKYVGCTKHGTKQATSITRKVRKAQCKTIIRYQCGQFKVLILEDKPIESARGQIKYRSEGEGEGARALLCAGGGCSCVENDRRVMLATNRKAKWRGRVCKLSVPNQLRPQPQSKAMTRVAVTS